MISGSVVVGLGYLKTHNNFNVHSMHRDKCGRIDKPLPFSINAILDIY